MLWNGDRVALLLLVVALVQSVRAVLAFLNRASAEKDRLQNSLGAAAAWTGLGAWLYFSDYDFTERLLNSLALGFSLWFAAAFLARRLRKLTPSDWFYDWGWSGFSAVWLALIIRASLVEVYSIPSESMVPTLLINDHVVVSKTTFGWHLPFTRGRFLQFRPVKRGEIVIFTPPNAPKQNWVKRCVGVPGDTVEIRDKILYIDGEPAEVPYSYGLIEGDIPPAAQAVLQAKAEAYLAVRGAELRSLMERGRKDQAAGAAVQTTWIGPLQVEGVGTYYLEASAARIRIYARLLDKPKVGTFNTLPKDWRLPAGNLDWAGDHGLGNRDWFGPYKLGPDEYWMLGDDRDNSLDSRFIGPIKVEALRGTPLWRYWPPSRWGSFQ